jgi:hypothetical protein
MKKPQNVMNLVLNLIQYRFSISVQIIDLVPTMKIIKPFEFV